MTISLKLVAPGSHPRGVSIPIPPAPMDLGLRERSASATEEAEPLEFEAVYRRYFHECCRWMRAMGAPESDLEDLAQEVFLVVRRKLGDEPIHNPGGWIYGVAWRTVSDHRRRAWWKNLLDRRSRRAPVELVDPAPGPAEAVERAEEARLCARVLDRMSAVRRTTFVLYEIEGYSGEEIATLQCVPLKTVWTRLHYARKAFIELADIERRAAKKP